MCDTSSFICVTNIAIVWILCTLSFQTYAYAWRWVVGSALVTIVVFPMCDKITQFILMLMIKTIRGDILPSLYFMN